MYHTTTGKIIYDPRRTPNVKKGEKWWCVCLIDKEITRYYRWWIKKELHIKNLCAPSWDAHISIIRGEKPNVLYLWKKYHNKIITFKYKHEPQLINSFWFIEIESPEMMNIRKELELPCNWKLHLTVGRVWY